MPAFHQHLGRHGAGVVGAGHHKAVGAGTEQGEMVAFGHARDGAILAEGVAGFANRADHIGLHGTGLALFHGDNFVVAFVKCRADKIVHCGIDNRKIFFARILHMLHSRDEDSCIARNETTGLDKNLEAKRLEPRHERGGVLGRGQDILRCFAVPPFHIAAG